MHHIDNILNVDYCPPPRHGKEITNHFFTSIAVPHREDYTAKGEIPEPYVQRFVRGFVRGLRFCFAHSAQDSREHLLEGALLRTFGGRCSTVRRICV